MMRLFKILLTILRLIFGLVYILSGFFKIVDPVGTGLVVEEYLNVMHLGFFRFGALPFGILLSLFEFLVGISILLGIRMKIATTAGLVVSSFFTLLTFIIALVGGITDCGCFGEVIHLTMWETFFKNVALTLCIIPLFIHRTSFRPVAPVPAEWALIAVYGVFALFTPVYALFTIPLVEFGDYRLGTNVAIKIDELTNSSRFETVFVYEKDGRQKYFDLEHLPDETWTYVDTKTLYEGDENGLQFDMSITDMNGEIVSEKIANSEDPVFLFVAYRPDRLGDGYWDRLSETLDSLLSSGAIPYVLVPSYDARTAAIAEKYPLISKSLSFGDYKTLISMVRSNGGVVYMSDGVVVKKWPGWKFREKEIAPVLSRDAEDITVKGSIRQHIFYEITILMIFVILIIFRFVCGILYGKPQRKEVQK